MANLFFLLDYTLNNVAGVNTNLSDGTDTIEIRLSKFADTTAWNDWQTPSAYDPLDPVGGSLALIVQDNITAGHYFQLRVSHDGFWYELEILGIQAYILILILHL